MAADLKTALTPEQYLELEKQKREHELQMKKLEITSAEKIATENNKVAAEANKVGFWANIVNAAKIAFYFIAAMIGLGVSIVSKRDDQAFELNDTYRAKESSKWSQKLFEGAMKRIEALKN